MNVNGDAMDRFFLAHAEERTRQVFLPARIAINNLGEEFETLAEREPVPENLRDCYRQVACVLAAPKAAMAEAEGQVCEILRKAMAELPAFASLLEPDQDQREAVLIAGKAIEAAESMAWKLLRQVHPSLDEGGREQDRAHATAKFSLLLDPGPDHQQYWLEDTDFNLLEVPTASLDLWGDNRHSKEAWTFELGSRMGPVADLDPHGIWLNGLLSWSAMNWEHLPMVRTIFVDFDFGMGMDVTCS